MPMVRRGHHHSLNVFVLVHLPEIGVPLGIGVADVLQGLVHAGFVGIAHPHDVDVAEFLEIRDVLFADESESDEADADAIVSPENSLVGRGCQRSRPQKRAPCGIRHSHSVPPP